MGASQKELPRITIPHKMQGQLQKLRQRQESTKNRFFKPSYKSPLVISCKRQNFNHHRGQTYSDWSPESLASYGWKSRKSAGDYFTITCHDKNPALLREDKAFAELGLDSDILTAVEALGFEKPTCIQNVAVPAILRGAHTLCAAETGSGKTLAYLLPTLSMLAQRKRSGMMSESCNTPSIIILTPNRELTDQVTSVAKSLQSHVDFSLHSVCGGRGTKGRLAWPIKKSMDVLVTTPGILRKLLIAGQIKSSGLQQVILDEADTLLDDSFMDTLDRVFRRLRIPALSNIGGAAGVQKDGTAVDPVPFVHGVQFVLVSATLPRDLQNNIGLYLPIESLNKVTTSGLHHIMPHVPQKFLRLLPSQKPEELLKLTRQSTPNASGTMVFCNTSATCFYLMHILQENGLQPVIINGEMTERNRRGVFEHFREGRHKLLVATDVASRGLDTVNVHHVINYDFPGFVSDYIHRAGRVGRVGSSHSGLVTSFITHKWEVDVLWQIEMAARKATELHNVNANIKRKRSADLAKKHGKSMDDF